MSAPEGEHTGGDAISDPLGTFIDFADKIMALKAPEIPAYAETCPCGGTVAVSREVPPADRRRIYTHFVGRHRTCVTPPEVGAP